MPRKIRTLGRKIRTKKEILSDFLTDLVKNGMVDLQTIPFEGYLEANYDQLMELLLEKLYESEKYNGATLSTLDAFYHFCNYVVRFDFKTKKLIWNDFVK